MNEMLYQKVQGFLRNAVSEALRVDDSEMVDRLSRALICLETPASVDVFSDQFFQQWEADHKEDRQEGPRVALWTLPELREHIIRNFGFDPERPVSAFTVARLTHAYGEAFADCFDAWKYMKSEAKDPEDRYTEVDFERDCDELFRPTDTDRRERAKQAKQALNEQEWRIFSLYKEDPLLISNNNALYRYIRQQHGKQFANDMNLWADLRMQLEDLGGDYNDD